MPSWLSLLSVTELPQRFGIHPDPETDLRPRDDIVPPQSILVVIEEPTGPCLRWVRWGFRPPWFLLRPSEPSITTVRAETLAKHVTFRQAVRHGRCVIPADGIGAWQRVAGQRVKRPVYVRLRTGGPFGIAGLYTEYVDERTGRRRASCAMVTTAANELFGALERRMPAVLRREDEGLWLQCSQTEPDAALLCLRPYPSHNLEVVPATGSGLGRDPLLRALSSVGGSWTPDAA